MFKSEIQQQQLLKFGEEVNPADIPALRDYLVDKVK